MKLFRFQDFRDRFMDFFQALWIISVIPSAVCIVKSSIPVGSISIRERRFFFRNSVLNYFIEHVFLLCT